MQFANVLLVQRMKAALLGTPCAEQRAHGQGADALTMSASHSPAIPLPPPSECKDDCGAPHPIGPTLPEFHPEPPEMDDKCASPGFEGCEKRLIVTFCGDGDLRCIPTADWVAMLKFAKCSILSTVSNDQCIAHLLSESSLFVWDQRLMIKTCGTTTLLQILPVLLSKGEAMGLGVDEMFFSRSNFMFPEHQPTLHRSFENEVDYLDGFFRGRGVVLGSQDKARWHCYTKTDVDRQDAPRRRSLQSVETLEIVLFDLDPECMKLYFRDFDGKRNVDDHVMTGCDIPDTATVDTHSFDPCGYSLNGILDDKYWSIHITPESEGSFVSFETDFEGESGYRNTVQSVVGLFRPKRFSVAVNTFGDGAGAQDVAGGDWTFAGFVKRDSSSHRFSWRHSIWWSSYEVPSGEMLAAKSLWEYVQSRVLLRPLCRALTASPGHWMSDDGGDDDCGKGPSSESPISESSGPVSSPSDSDEPPLMEFVLCTAD